jgi:hypothetical protein
MYVFQVKVIIHVDQANFVAYFWYKFTFWWSTNSCNVAHIIRPLTSWLNQIKLSNEHGWWIVSCSSKGHKFFVLWRMCYGKQHYKKFPTNIVHKKAYIFSELIHANLCRPMNVTSINNYLYFFLFNDDYINYRIIFYVQCKSQNIWMFAMYVQANATPH